MRDGTHMHKRSKKWTWAVGATLIAMGIAGWLMPAKSSLELSP